MVTSPPRCRARATAELPLSEPVAARLPGPDRTITTGFCPARHHGPADRLDVIRPRLNLTDGLPGLVPSPWVIAGALPGSCVAWYTRTAFRAALTALRFGPGASDESPACRPVPNDKRLDEGKGGGGGWGGVPGRWARPIAWARAWSRGRPGCQWANPDRAVRSRRTGVSPDSRTFYCGEILIRHDTQRHRHGGMGQRPGPWLQIGGQKCLSRTSPAAGRRPR